MNLEVVHLVERHLLGDLLEEVKREGLAANVQDETTDLVQRVVAGGTDGEAVLARLHALENGLATPVGASDLLGRHDDAVGLGLQQVALVAEALGASSVRVKKMSPAAAEVPATALTPAPVITE